MPKKKGFTPEKYEEVMLGLIKQQPFMSTNEFCKELNMGYDTALKYLNGLYKSNKIKLKKVGNRQFWYI